MFSAIICFIRKLMSSDDKSTDAVIFYTGMALGTQAVLTAFDTLVHAAHFDAQAYGIGAASIIFGGGLGQMVRDNVKMKSVNTGGSSAVPDKPADQ